MFPTKILLAIDGSEESQRAARLAVTLAETFDSELHIVYSEPMPSAFAYPETTIYQPELQTEVRERAESFGREKLQTALEVLGDTGEVDGTYVGIGRPDAEIVRIGEEIGAGLLVLGSRGLGPIRRAVMGSVSASVVRHAHGPVLVVRDGGSDAGDRASLRGPVVLAIDGSEEAKRAAQVATELSTGTGSPVHIIYVMPDPERLLGPHNYSEEIKSSLIEQARADARRFLEERAENVRSGGASVVQTYLGTGRPDEEILELAEEIDAVMVVTGSRGLGGVRRALLGSVSESVVHHAHCPVLVVRDANHLRVEDRTA